MSEPEEDVYLDPSHAAGAAFLSRRIPGEVVMLNLLRFRAVADYSAFPELAPRVAITGREAYERYIQHTLPFLTASGGRVLYAGTGGEYLIGPPGQGWDMALLIEQRSVASFMAFASDPAYQAGIGHRVAGVRDSRILPLVRALVPASD
jgi:uncharacterized protein (DUF1330 family)